MPRPSLKPQRTEEILDAFERCIVQYGMHGASLERIAEEAKVQRTILRHYIGNRDDLIITLAQRFESRSKASLASLKAMLPKRNRVQTMVKFLFGGKDSFDRDENLLADALIVEANRLPEVKHLLTSWFDSFVRFIEDELADEYPSAKRSDCHAAALGILSTFFLMGSLRPMTDSPKLRRAAKKTALQLIGALAD